MLTFSTECNPKQHVPHLVLTVRDAALSFSTWLRKLPQNEIHNFLIDVDMERLNNLKEKAQNLNNLLSEYHEDRLKRLKEEKERLRLEQQLGDLPYKVLHFSENPTDQAIRDKKQAIDNLRKENERLRTRIAILESNERRDGILNSTGDSSDGSKQVEALTRQVDGLKLREERILNHFKITSSEFKEVCYLLTGYRIDPLKDGEFRLSHMYAEHEEDKLYFEIKGDGTTLLLGNKFTDQYDRLIKNYLEDADSFPAFLAAITLDLFKSQTRSIIDMSVTMSTAVLPANTTRRSFAVDRSEFPNLK